MNWAKQNHLVDPDGGDLGIATGQTRIEQLPYLVMRIGYLFSELRSIKPKDRMFSYCFQVNPDYKDTLKYLIQDIKREGLPDGVDFYSTDGNYVFDLRGPSGGVSFAVCCYLICK